MGEIYMIAVDPTFQRRGIAGELTRHSLEWFQNAGMSIAMVETGGDPGHAPRDAHTRLRGSSFSRWRDTSRPFERAA